MFGICGVFIIALENFIKIVLLIVGIIAVMFCYACCKVSSYCDREDKLEKSKRFDEKR